MSRFTKSIIKCYHSLRLLLCMEGYRRAEYIRKHNLFGSMGKNCYFHPWKVPGDPKLIFIHDNVKISSDVTFICHDISDGLLNTKYNTNNFQYFTAPIEIFDNVLIGTGTIMLPGKTIGPNCVIGGGTVVSRNIPAEVVAAGNPVRVIESFDTFVKKRTSNNALDGKMKDE